MEGDVLQAARRLFADGGAEVLSFALNENDMVQGLICGGSLDVLIETLSREHLPLLTGLKMTRDEGKDCVIGTLLRGRGPVLKVALRTPADAGELTRQWSDFARGGQAMRASLPPVGLLIEETQKAHHRHETRRIPMPEGELILEPLQGRPHLVIFGGGHVSRYVSRTAAMTGFRVTVVDDRREYANAARFPEADETLAVEFHEALQHVAIKPSTFVLIVTRGHRSDEEVLEQVLGTPAGYVGMIGSRRKVLTTYQHLMERGISAAALRTVHAPVGLELGAVTAEEIAVSIVAEIIRVRRGANDPAPSMSQGMGGLLDEAARPSGTG